LKELKTIKTRVLLRLKPLALAHAARRTHQRGSCPSQDPSALRPASSRTRCLLSPGTNRYCNSVGSCCPAWPKIEKYPTFFALPTTMTQHPIESFLHQDLTSLDHAQQQDPTLWVLLGRQTQQSGVGLSHSKSDPVIDLKKTSRPARSTHNSDDPEKIQKRPFFFHFFSPTLKWRDKLKNQKLKK